VTGRLHTCTTGTKRENSYNLSKINVSTHNRTGKFMSFTYGFGKVCGLVDSTIRILDVLGSVLFTKAGCLAGIVCSLHQWVQSNAEIILSSTPRPIITNAGENHSWVSKTQSNSVFSFIRPQFHSNPRKYKSALFQTTIFWSTPSVILCPLNCLKDSAWKPPQLKAVWL
jgi:hypothetical protein